MRADGGESGNEEEEECPWTPEVVDGVVGKSDKEVVHGLLLVHVGVLHEDRTQSVEKFDHQVEDVFVPTEFRGEFGFPGKGQIGVAVDFAQEVVVIRVVLSEGDGRRQCHGDVAEYGHNFVDGEILVPSEVDEIVDAAMQGVVQKSSHQVGVEEKYPYILVLNGKEVTLAQYPLASMMIISATAMMIVQGLSTTSSWATCGYLVSIIFLRSRCDSSPFTQVKSCLTPLVWSYMWSSSTGGVLRLVRQLTGVSVGQAALLFDINDYRRTEIQNRQKEGTVKRGAKERGRDVECKAWTQFEREERGFKLGLFGMEQ